MLSMILFLMWVVALSVYAVFCMLHLWRPSTEVDISKWLNNIWKRTFVQRTLHSVNRHWQLNFWHWFSLILFFSDIIVNIVAGISLGWLLWFVDVTVLTGAWFWRTQVFCCSSGWLLFLSCSHFPKCNCLYKCTCSPGHPVYLSLSGCLVSRIPGGILLWILN